ncbi:MAG TPA: DUF4435 domain-containing protein [Cellvibrio sp.]|nr:DUF4435 domain-containing protein [Cellvibrio sp.]
MTPERSSVAKSAKSVFFEDINDIDIYVEDTASGYAKLYTIIFSRFFDGEYKVDKVFPVGDRNSVIKLHEKHQSSRPSIYLIDGDLFMLAGDEIESKPGLFKLPIYCIENLLCDPEAILDVLDEEEPTENRENIVAQFNYEDWIDKNCDLLFQIFIEYSISFKINRDLKTVSYPVNSLVICEKGNICRDKVQRRIEEVQLSSISIVGDEAYVQIKMEMLSHFNDESKRKLNIVSGKDYLFPLLKMRAKSIVKTKISDINFKQRIAKRCDVSLLSNIHNYILR